MRELTSREYGARWEGNVNQEGEREREREVGREGGRLDNSCSSPWIQLYFKLTLVFVSYMNQCIFFLP